MVKVLPWLVAGLGVALVACAAPQAAPAQPGGASDTPKSGGTLNTYGDDFTDFDMVYQGKTGENAKDHGLLYDRLLEIQKGPGLGLLSDKLAPSLAEKWEVAPDGRVFTYSLRQGVKYANIAPVNGRELTSADVKWSMEYYSRTGQYGDKKLPTSQMEGMYEGIDGIDTPDKYTVRVRFKEPYIPFLNYSASEWMPIAAKETFDASMTPPRINTLVGSGPFIYDVANSQKGSRFVFTKNPTYWGGPQKPYLDSIRRLVIPDDSTRMAAFQVKQIDVHTALNVKAAQQIKAANPDAVEFKSLNPGHRILFLSQLRNGPLRDIRVRRAISMGLDRDEYNKLWASGEGTWALTGSYPGLFTEAETRQLLKYDPEQSKKLLAEAGYAPGTRLEFMPPGTSPDPSEELIQAQLKKIGLDIYFTLLPREQNRARLYVGEYDLFHPGGAVIGDADFDSFQFSFHSTSGQNWAVIKDPELDRLILAQRREVDPAKRREAQRAVVLRINDQAWNPGILFSPTIVFWHPYVKNMEPHWTAGEYDRWTWLDK